MTTREIKQLKKAAAKSGQPIEQLIAGHLGIFGIYFGHKVCPKKRAEYGRAVKKSALLAD